MRMCFILRSLSISTICFIFLLNPAAATKRSLDLSDSEEEQVSSPHKKSKNELQKKLEEANLYNSTSLEISFNSLDQSSVELLLNHLPNLPNLENLTVEDETLFNEVDNKQSVNAWSSVFALIAQQKQLRYLSIRTDIIEGFEETNQEFAKAVAIMIEEMKALKELNLDLSLHESSSWEPIALAISSNEALEILELFEWYIKAFVESSKCIKNTNLKKLMLSVEHEYSEWVNLQSGQMNAIENLLLFNKFLEISFNGILETREVADSDDLESGENQRQELKEKFGDRVVFLNKKSEIETE